MYQFNVVTPYHLILKGYPVITIFEDGKQAAKFARKLAKAVGEPIEVQRSPEPYRAHIMIG